MTHQEAKWPSCPTATTQPNGTPHTIVGCGSTNVVRDESEPNLWDCLDCGIWFDPSQEADRGS